MTKDAYGLEPRVNIGGLQAIETLKSDKKNTYDNLAEAAKD